MEWIKATDRLPERQQPGNFYSNTVFVFSSTMGTYSGHYNYEMHRWEAHAPFVYLEVEGVTHWAEITLPVEGE